ncbi:hypothetical protein AX17_007398 [Amanita inopinata Kibby_2008]|nr:hypothetical protein AX17_007398 [Amanita inopinata Kibby_2008]
MSSKRGRKRNDNLPPNRARDVQRAFRARRAAHLQALEQRVSELEEENNCLRHALNLPPSNRPPLGKGPTGKDKPRQSENSSTSPAIGMPPSRNSSNDNSPGSRTSSLSPRTLTVSMPTRSMQVIESGTWDDQLIINDQQSDVSAPSGSSYAINMNAPSPMKPLHFTSYSSPSPSSRNSTSSLYIPTTAQYPHSTDRVTIASYRGHTYTQSEDMHDEPPRNYSTTYSHSTFQPSDSDLHAHSPPPPPPSIPPPHSHHRESPLPYPHRRCMTDPQGYPLSQGYLHLPHPAQLQHDARGPEYPRLPDSHGHLHSQLVIHPHAQPQSRSAFVPDACINSMS